MFSINDDDCDGSTPSIVSSTQCLVPLSSLIALPYSLTLGESVSSYIVAVNAYGNSI